eukprot:GEMP01014482.1.p1 GENE.GEMP01014482.1~~GEMP01014482.1.p1  ORF type:complete len:162 (+),score=27.92 GEMP01014482.1:1155-1640(+)
MDINTFLHHLSPHDLLQNLMAPEARLVVFLDFRGPSILLEPSPERHAVPMSCSAPSPFYVLSRGPTPLPDDESSFCETFLSKVDMPISLADLSAILRGNHDSDDLVVCSSTSFPADHVSLAFPRGGVTNDSSSDSGISSDNSRNAAPTWHNLPLPVFPDLV